MYNLIPLKISGLCMIKSEKLILKFNSKKTIHKIVNALLMCLSKLLAKRMWFYFHFFIRKCLRISNP
jgi:hypothetical protein